jgi:hypothetical protein
MKNVWKQLVLGGFAAALLTLPTAATATAPGNDQEVIAQQVRHELVTLPFYSIWDNLNFKVEGTKVTLMGEVQRPSMKTSAERVAMRVPGVTEVENQIEVLPLSSFDNRIRIAVARAIFGNPVLSQYALRSVSPIAPPNLALVRARRSKPTTRRSRPMSRSMTKTMKLPRVSA